MVSIEDQGDVWKFQSALLEGFLVTSPISLDYYVWLQYSIDAAYVTICLRTVDNIAVSSKR